MPRPVSRWFKIQLKSDNWGSSMKVQTKTSNDHWNKYYRSADAPSIPSQFCVFVANELLACNQVVEFACGNGRDAFFFADSGKIVFASDASESAIVSCNTKKNSAGSEVEFCSASVDDDSLWVRINAFLASAQQDSTIFYSRFFIHAIDEDTERRFLRNVATAIAQFGGFFCLEFRTEADADLPKTTSAHYRRFVSTSDFIERAKEAGLDCIYHVEGFGMAKFRDDDANVARVILTGST